MKNMLLALFLALSAFGFAQDINQYKYVVVPIKFEFLKKPNQYRISSNLKFRLEKLGFTVLYSNQDLPLDLAQDKCSALYADLDKSGSFVLTKLQLLFKDCSGKVLFSAKEGKSKQKDFEKAYNESLEQTVASVADWHYQYNGKVTAETFVAPAKAIEKVEEGALFAQPIANGYQLVDTTPKVVLKLTKTSQPDYFLANADGKQGVVYLKNGNWFFDYYSGDQLISEKLNIKF